MLALGLLVGLLVGPGSATADPPGLPLQLSLGDSWGSGVGAPPGQGYVDLLHRELRDRWDCLPASSPRVPRGCKQLRLVNLAQGGATTPSMLATQVPVAVDLLETRNHDRNRHNDVEVVTVHIGGNDVVSPVLAACLEGLTPACLVTIETELATFRADLDTALGALRAAAGPGTPIVVGTYDNPIPTCQLGPVPGAVTLGAMVLEGDSAVPGAPVTAGLHDLIREVAAEHDAEVAEVFGRLAPGDWVGGADCLHPVASGYEVVADTFLEALGVAGR